MIIIHFLVIVIQQNQSQSQITPSMSQVSFPPQQQTPPNKISTTEKRERPGRQQVYQADKAPPAPFPQSNVASSHQQQQQQPPPPPSTHQQHTSLTQQNSVEGQIVIHKSDHRKVWHILSFKSFFKSRDNSYIRISFTLRFRHHVEEKNSIQN